MSFKDNFTTNHDVGTTNEAYGISKERALHLAEQGKMVAAKTFFIADYHKTHAHKEMVNYCDTLGELLIMLDSYHEGRQLMQETYDIHIARKQKNAKSAVSGLAALLGG